jgi:cell division inhibitor SepF
MANIFRNFFGVDEYYNEQGEFDQEADVQSEAAPTSAAASTQSSTSRPAASRRPNVLPLDGQRDASSKIALYEPRIYSDAKAIVTQILAGEAVIVNFGSIEDATARRIVDFMMGASFAVDGDVQRIGETIFLVTPHNFEISGTISQGLGQQY